MIRSLMTTMRYHARAAGIVVPGWTKTDHCPKAPYNSDAAFAGLDDAG